MLLKMGCVLLSHVHTFENIILLGHSTVWCLLVSLLSITAERSRTEWLTAITGL